MTSAGATADDQAGAPPTLPRGARESDRRDGHERADPDRGEQVCTDPDGTDPFAGELPAPAGAVRELTFGADDLSLLRQLVRGWASDEQLSVEGTNELVLAVNELGTNSVSYGGGEGTLRMWRERDTLICEVRDRGVIVDRMVGRVCPGPQQTGGRGLWLANQLCDLVQIRSGPHGSVVRAHKRLT